MRQWEIDEKEKGTVEGVDGVEPDGGAADGGGAEPPLPQPLSPQPIRRRARRRRKRRRKTGQNQFILEQAEVSGSDSSGDEEESETSSLGGGFLNDESDSSDSESDDRGSPAFGYHGPHIFRPNAPPQPLIQRANEMPIPAVLEEERPRRKSKTAAEAHKKICGRNKCRV